MKRTITTLILLLSISAYSYACECPEYNLTELDKESSEWSELIIIGNIIDTETKYQVNVNEVLKGEIANCAIEGWTIGENEVFDTCTFYPREKGEYLLYLKLVEVNGITYYFSSECLGSRLLNLKYQPVSLRTSKSKTQLIDETELWISELRKRKK